MIGDPKGLVALSEMPQGLTRFGSVTSAIPGMSDTILCWIYALLACEKTLGAIITKTDTLTEIPLMFCSTFLIGIVKTLAV